MGKRPDKMRPDVAETAFRTMLEATGQAPKTPPPGEREKNPEAVARGSQGGKTRKVKLTDKQRSEIAQRAARKRWESK